MNWKFQDASNNLSLLMFKNIGVDKMKFDESKYSQKITLNRKIAAKSKKMGIRGGYPTKFLALWVKIVILARKFSALLNNTIIHL